MLHLLFFSASFLEEIPEVTQAEELLPNQEVTLKEEALPVPEDPLPEKAGLPKADLPPQHFPEALPIGELQKEKRIKARERRIKKEVP